MRSWQASAFAAAALAVVIGVVIAAGTRTVALALARPLIVADPLRRADAIVVLGAGIYDQTTLRAPTAYRLLYGLQLLRQGLAPVLVLSGGSHRGVPGTDAEAMAVVAANAGVDRTALLLESAGSSTAEQARRVTALAARHGIRSVLLVTSPIKMRRAVLTFRRAGLDVVAAPGLDDRDTLTTRLLAGEDHFLTRLGVTAESLGEYLACVVYWWRDWM
jgi:uncharacterized SAM-binding protein YcdF (DUF218 family)